MTHPTQALRWRVGRSLGRTLYRDDVWVGELHGLTVEEAAEVVAVLNARDRPGGPPFERCCCPYHACQEPKTFVEDCRIDLCRRCYESAGSRCADAAQPAPLAGPAVLAGCTYDGNLCEPVKSNRGASKDGWCCRKCRRPIAPSTGQREPEESTK